MQNKIITFYSIFLILIFIILYTADRLYKKYVINLETGNHYEITALQAFELKENSLNILLTDILLKEGESKNEPEIYNVNNFLIQQTSSNYTISSSTSLIRFELILLNYIDPISLQEKLNKKYLASVNKVINIIEKNLSLFDYKYLEEEYDKHKSLEIKKAYNELVNSEFFAKFQPAKCYDNEEICLKLYIKFYNFILDQIDLNNSNTILIELFNFEQNDDLPLTEIIQQFYSNRILFDKEDLFIDFYDEIPRSKFQFFSEKYDRLVKSEFFRNYILNPKSHCRYYRKGCFQTISDHFNTMLYKHRMEKDNKFEVKFVKKISKNKNPIEEIPKILGISLLLTYIFFIFTNKFFRRKLK